MKCSLTWLSCALLAASAQLANAQPPAMIAVIPAPQSLALHAGAFVLASDTPVLASDAQALPIAQYFAALLAVSPPLSLKVSRAPPRTGAIAFVLDDAAGGEGPESYQIDISPDRGLVRARGLRGLFYGAVTLWELASVPAPGGAVRLPALELTDAPRFRWRGLMLDSARHFQSPEFVMRYIDWMALHKLNVLCWHLTDDQGWRLEIRKYPRLTRVGAWRVPPGPAARRDIDPATRRPRVYGGFYTQQQVRRIVAHAAARGVTIVPEIDVPGHATAAIVAYPSLGVLAAAPREVPSDWGIYPNLFNVEESTFRFLEDVLTEVIALFPGGYVHLGGDEALKDQWRGSARVQARMRELGLANEDALQGYFTARLATFLKAHQRRAIGWDEILSAPLPADAVVMSWRGSAGAQAAAMQGHDTVLSPAPELYLDHRQGGAPDEPPGRGQVVTLKDVYAFEPLHGALAGDAAHLLGLQANLWTEHVRTEERAAYMTWPRAAALAEIAWTAPGARSWDSFVSRLPIQFDRYRALGIDYSADVFAPPRTLGLFDRHMSQDLATCSNRLTLNLEDDAPRTGARAVFLIDVENPCWMLTAPDLAGAHFLTAAVGQVPFNFQLPHETQSIRLAPPRTPAGELEVYADACRGTPVAVMPLAPAADNEAVSVLPQVSLPELSGAQALCMRFTQHTLDPMWALDWIQLSP